MEIWEPKPPGTLWATPGLLRDCCTFTFLQTENGALERLSGLGDVQFLTYWQALLVTSSG
jgi:hypothetical protein